MKTSKKIICCVLAVLLLFSFCCYGCRGRKPQGGKPPVDEPVKEGFGIYGVTDTTITAGKFFDVMDGISARTESGEDITDKISVSGELNTSRVGSYTLTYTVSHLGESESLDRRITVVSNAAVGQEPPTFIYEAQDSFNIAKGCTATATQTDNDSVGNATDGNSATRWESNHFGSPIEGEHIVNYTVDLGEVLPIEGVVIDWESAYAKKFSLQISSDGRNYQTVEEVADNNVTVSNNHAVQSFSFESGIQARYVRVRCIERVTVFGYSIWELQVLGKRSTVIPEESYPVLFKAQSRGDRDWAQEDEQWLLFDLGGVRQTDKIKIAFKSWLTPYDYEVFYGTSENDLTPIALKNIPYSGDTFYLYENRDSQTAISVSARYIKIAMRSRMFYVPAYSVTDARFWYGDNKHNVTSVTSSSTYGEHTALLAADESEDTYWESAHEDAPQTIDLGEVKNVGRIDMYWRGDDGGKGKYYDLQVSNDGENYTTVFRQNHGATQKQSVYYYGAARYIRVLDYQSPNSDRFMLEGIEVFSQYPDGYEQRVEYDTSIKFPEQKVLTAANGNGSYVTGDVTFPSARLIAYLDDDLRDKPIPTNDWWQGLLMRDKGYNMYLNPLVATFTDDGLWLTNPGDGYYSGDNPGNGRQTINVDVHDICIGYRGMKSTAEVRVTDFTDYGITTVMTDNPAVDKLTTFLSQGALYAYCLFAEPQKATISSNGLIAAYDLNGVQILGGVGASYTGDCIVVCVRTHSGYENDKENGNEKQYEERFYVVNTPADTQFVREENHIAVVMNNGNYMSVGALSGVVTVSARQATEQIAHGSFNIAEAELLHSHGYAFIVGTSCTYSVDDLTNDVTTVYTAQTYTVRGGESGEAVTAFMPHHYKKSADKCSAEYVYKSVRGDIRAHVGNTYSTVDKFYGVVPTFTEPNDDGYSAQALYNQLVMLYKNNGGDNPPDKSLVSGDPYWQGKNLHPMAIAALAADQIGATDIRDAFLTKIRYILEDWFTYTPGEETDGKSAYFYYDGEWGTLYYRNSEFGAGVNLADHHFTYGYYMLATGVLSAYQPDFAAKYKDMIELMLRDYMNTSRNDEMFPYMRNYDVFAGHGWAGGYADNDGGNNQESAGEALNSWVGAYLYACAVGNDTVKKAAMYGFTTELNAIKTYWFNYDGDAFADFYPFGTLGQLYGGSNFFGTFFNGEPLYMYGIHLIPGEEFLTSYALNAKEQTQLKAMITSMREEQARWNTEEDHKRIYAWQHIFIPIVASYDPDEAIEWYEQTLYEQGNVGNTSEQFNVYYMIHALKSLGSRSTDIWAENGMPATVYFKDGKYTALCYNPTQSPLRYTFRNASGAIGSATVPAGGLVTCDPMKTTDSFPTYVDCNSVKLTDYAVGEGVSVSGEKLHFNNGKVTYYISCGDGEQYRRIRLRGNQVGASVTLGGKTYALHSDGDGYVTDPFVVTFKQTLTVTAASGSIDAVLFEERRLIKVNVAGATATASSENNAENVAQNIVDGNEKTRWESRHNGGVDNGENYDDEYITITLPQSITVYQMKILWEAASAAEYKVYFSDSGQDNDWVEVYNGKSSQGGDRTDTLTPAVIMQTRYVKIVGIKRSTNYGYSIYETEFYNFG